MSAPTKPDLPPIEWEPVAVSAVQPIPVGRAIESRGSLAWAEWDAAVAELDRKLAGEPPKESS